MSNSIHAEDEYGKKWDRFGANCIMRMGTGLAVGSLVSLLIFKRRTWPIHFALGVGLGFSINDLQHDLNRC